MSRQSRRLKSHPKRQSLHPATAEPPRNPPDSCGRSMMSLVGTIDPFDDPEAFAVEEHVLGKLPQAAEISAVGLSPIRKTSRSPSPSS